MDNEAKTTRLLTPEEIAALSQDSAELEAAQSPELTARLLHTLGYWKLQCEMLGQEIGDLRNLTLGEMRNASFVESYREVLAELKGCKAKIEDFPCCGKCDSARLRSLLESGVAFVRDANQLLAADGNLDEEDEDGANDWVASAQAALRA